MEFNHKEPNDLRLEPVIEALADPEWDFRTIGGMATSSSLTEDDVKEVLKLNPEIFRVPVFHLDKSEDLYTLAERTPSWGERWKHFRQHLATW
jgi:hypothetical protein